MSEHDISDRLQWECDGRPGETCIFCDARSEIDRLRARVAELVSLICEVVNHGDASGDKKLLDRLMAATPEAGWSDQAAVLNAPANAKEELSEVTIRRERSEWPDRQEHPRPAQSPAGAVVVVSDEMVERLRANLDMRVAIRLTRNQAREALQVALNAGAPRSEIGR